MFLQPRKFGKTLFTSTLEYYYDIKTKDKFENLYGGTYIGKNPTALKNSYHILRFNFSGIDTSSVEATIKGFKNEVASSINGFAVRYGLDFFVNNNDEAENILNNLFKAFYLQKTNEKIYVIIDEYDHFANELLGFHTEQFKELVSKNGIIRITVWDYNGNSTKELVKIENIDRSRPKVESINYSDPDENGKVNVTIVANEKITAMSNENELAQGWINLSDNTIQKVYDESELTGAGTKEKLFVVDEAGNRKTIKITDKIIPRVVNITKEKNDGYTNVTIQMSEKILFSDKLVDIDWDVSKDGYFLNKYVKASESFVVTDFAGNSSEIIDIEVEETGEAEIKKLYKNKKYEPSLLNAKFNMDEEKNITITLKASNIKLVEGILDYDKDVIEYQGIEGKNNWQEGENDNPLQISLVSDENLNTEEKEIAVLKFKVINAENIVDEEITIENIKLVKNDDTIIENQNLNLKISLENDNEDDEMDYSNLNEDSIIKKIDKDNVFNGNIVSDSKVDYEGDKDVIDDEDEVNNSNLNQDNNSNKENNQGKNANSNENNGKDTTIVDKILPQTGQKISFVIIFIVLLAGISAFLYKKIKK